MVEPDLQRCIRLPDLTSSTNVVIGTFVEDAEEEHGCLFKYLVENVLWVMQSWVYHACRLCYAYYCGTPASLSAGDRGLSLTREGSGVQGVTLPEYLYPRCLGFDEKDAGKALQVLL